MTGPAEDAQTTVQAVQANADRLGLVWKRRPATVTSINPVEAAFDGDTESIAMTPMISGVYVGQRVYVDIVPPAGNFICGVVDAGPDPTAWVASNANTGGVTAEAPILMVDAALKAGRAYKVSFQNDVSSAAAFDTVVHRIYAGSILGTLLHATGFQLNQTPGFTEGLYSEVTVVATAAVAAQTFTLSLFAVTGPATAIGSATQLRWLKVEDVGPGTGYPGAITV